MNCTFPGGRWQRVLAPALVLTLLTALIVLIGWSIAEQARAANSASSAAVGTSGQTVTRFGEDITVPAGATRDAAIAFGGDIVVDGRVVDSVVAFGGDVTIRGSVGSSVVAFGGDVTVDGAVDDSVVAFGGDVRLRRQAVVGSDRPASETTVALVGGELIRDPGARVNGNVGRVGAVHWGDVVGWVGRGAFAGPLFQSGFFGWVVQTALLLVLALGTAALMPRQFAAVHRELERRPWPSLGWGALMLLVALPAILAVLVISIIGLLVVIPYVVAVLLACFFAVTAVAAWLAQRIVCGFGGRENLMLAVTFGVIGTAIITRLPGVGSLLILAMMAFGIGAGILAVVSWRRARPRPAPSPVGAGPEDATSAPGPVGGAPAPVGGEAAPVGAGTAVAVQDGAAVIAPLVQTAPDPLAAGSAAVVEAAPDPGVAPTPAGELESGGAPPTPESDGDAGPRPQESGPASGQGGSS